MVKKLLLGGFFVLIVLVIVIAVLRQKSHLSFRESGVTADELSPVIADGDIILRLGDRVWSAMLRDMSPNDKRFSHMGIVEIKDDVVSVIHTEAYASDNQDFVKSVPLSEFLEIAQSVGIYRVNDVDGNLISTTAQQYLNRPFDWHFDMSDDSKLYCTELIYVVLQQIAPHIQLNTIFIKEIGREILPLDICFQSEYFSEIGYW